jgi:hypothetical protein
MRIVIPELGAIDYRMNLLGIRVRTNTAQLIARFGEGWTTLGASRELPLGIPKTPSGLRAAASDTLLLTAYQYDSEHPGTDLGEVLAQTKTSTGDLEIRMSAGGASGA